MKKNIYQLVCLASLVLVFSTLTAQQTRLLEPAGNSLDDASLLPFATGTDEAFVEFVIPAADINLVGGSLRKIAFYQTNTAAGSLGPVTIYLANATAAGNYSAGTGAADQTAATSGFTQVYTGAYPGSGLPGYQEVDLATPFDYTGGDLKVLIYSQVSGTSGCGYTNATTPHFRLANLDAAETRLRWGSTLRTACTAGTEDNATLYNRATLVASVPHTRLVFAGSDNLTVGTPAQHSFCPEAQVVLGFSTANVFFNLGNVFTIELSDASGSFDSPTVVGSLMGSEAEGSNLSGQITATIPAGAAPGTGYRFRLASSNPPLAGRDNATNLTILARPSTPVAAYDGPKCEGETVKLGVDSPDANLTYTWSGPQGFAAQGDTVEVLIASAVQAGDYTVVASSGGCGSVSATVAVAANPAPVALVAGTNSPVCTGNLLTLNAATEPNISYLWTGPNGFSSTDQNPVLSESATLDLAGDYQLVAIAAGCTSAVSSVTVIVDQRPDHPEITRTGNMLTSSAASGNMWLKNDELIPGATGQSYLPESAGSYSVVVLAGDCADTSDTFVYTIVAIDGGVAPASMYAWTSADGYLVLQGTTPGMSLFLTDLSGRTLATQPADDSASRMYTAHLPGGIYVLAAINEQGRVLYRNRVLIQQR